MTARESSPPDYRVGFSAMRQDSTRVALRRAMTTLNGSSAASLTASHAAADSQRSEKFFLFIVATLGSRASSEDSTGERCGNARWRPRCCTDLLDGNPASILLLDTQQRVVYANPAADQLVGTERLQTAFDLTFAEARFAVALAARLSGFKFEIQFAGAAPHST